MAKKSSSAFDDLLETFSVPEDRKAFEELAGKNPQVKEYGLRQSDYSRKMSEVQESIGELEQWRDWRAKNWDDEHKMTKAELGKLQQLESLQREKETLEQQVALGGAGDEVNFEQLEAWGKNLAEKQGFVTATALKSKEQTFEDAIKTAQNVSAFQANAAMTVNYLNLRHNGEFGEPFDPSEFLTGANQKNRSDLTAYYDEYVGPKREAKRQAKYDADLKKVQDDSAAEIAKAREEGKQEADRARAMGAQGQPGDSEGPQMAAFQKRYLGLEKKPEDGSGAPEVPLGEGAVAAYGAREFINRTGPSR